MRNNAKKWLADNEIISLIGQENIFFEDSQIKKIEKINDLGCDIFIDDLPEIFSHQKFPMQIKKILFDPNYQSNNLDVCNVANSWSDVENYIYTQAT